ncbi:hypothetical protein [Aquipuribacter hungaricus]|uniref:YfdX protein n=1 Tax=Aquipuribacter hungaricus TaxID=545624 RepID=A0ABV7WHB3_9MICO
MASQKSMIISELRALLRLTETEIQVAETRRAQARTDAVRSELSQNADNGRLRATAIATLLREEGGVPDVVSSAAGRVAAVAKSNLEQGQPFTEALLGDLALEHQLQDRARLLKALGSAAGRQPVVDLADRLVEAHGATVEWLTVVLAEVALGGPAALKPTPVQVVVGAGVSLATLPARQVGRRVDSLVGRASRVMGSAGEKTQQAAEKLDDLQQQATAKVDDLQQQATAKVGDLQQQAAATVEDLQQQATTAAKQELAPDEDELPVVGYDQLTKARAIALVKTLSQPEDVRKVVAYEESHRQRADVVSAAQVRLAEIAKDVVLD